VVTRFVRRNNATCHSRDTVVEQRRTTICE
ncbi:uncharacterized protein METZ01_LOCUS95844, partial [marine metagenome]